MKTLKLRTKDREVYTLCELLNKLGFPVLISDSFTLQVDIAVKQFQKQNNLVVDGIVGMKTWQVLLEKNAKLLQQNGKFLSEQDLLDFAKKYGLELSVVKAVNEIESSGKGFLINNKPKILFEGHVFWQQLKNQGINPENLANSSNADVLYPKWTKAFYLGGVNEYNRLNKAISLSPDSRVKKAALSSASWGCFQIMGYHAEKLGYGSIENFVNKMEIHEREHLNAFGKFLEVFGCLKFLRLKQWADFAKCYNGSAYKLNKYDVNLQKSYQKYSSH